MQLYNQLQQQGHPAEPPTDLLDKVAALAYEALHFYNTNNNS